MESMSNHKLVADSNIAARPQQQPPFTAAATAPAATAIDPHV